MRILVTGPSGAIGAALARSLGGEHELRGLSRDPSRVAADLPLELFRGDAISGEGLEAALADVEVAYYLIHSMEPAADTGFEQRDRLAAERFALAAARAGVGRIIYLGGLGDPQQALGDYTAARRMLNLHRACPGCFSS